MDPDEFIGYKTNEILSNSKKFHAFETMTLDLPEIRYEGCVPSVYVIKYDGMYYGFLGDKDDNAIMSILFNKGSLFQSFPVRWRADNIDDLVEMIHLDRGYRRDF